MKVSLFRNKIILDFKWNEPKNGYTQDHQLIANYLDLVDSEAQVSIDNFSLNLLYYLSTFYHFLDSKLKMAQGHQSIEPLNQSPSTSRLLKRQVTTSLSTPRRCLIKTMSRKIARVLSLTFDN